MSGNFSLDNSKKRRETESLSLAERKREGLNMRGESIFFFWIVDFVFLLESSPFKKKERGRYFRPKSARMMAALPALFPRWFSLSLYRNSERVEESRKVNRRNLFFEREKVECRESEVVGEAVERERGIG